MINLRLMGKKGSNSCKDIREDAGVKRYIGKKYRTDVLVNYGLNGRSLASFYKKYPSAQKVPTINKQIGNSKYRVISMAKKAGIKVPDSRVSLKKLDKKEDWIEKRFNSQSGWGIRKARGKGEIPGKYYQKYIEDRTFEIRVHAFKWTKEWRVQKRYGKEGEIAWNHRNGGHFVSVHDPMRYRVYREAMDITDKVLDLLGMSFGAADFLVDKNNNVWFIEINSAPGFKELSKSIYVNAFKKLKDMSLKQVLKYT